MRRALAVALDHSGLLVAGTVLALAWANVDRESYERVADALHFAVNDIGMAFFFALAAKEVVEATASGGALHSPRRSAVPLIAAVGGMIGPAAIYALLVLAFDRPELMRGWAIPVATDVAFSYLVARVIFGARHPGIPFLLLLAIADDALGLLILALFYPTGELRLAAFAIILSVALTLAWWLRRRRTLNFWPYIIGAGAISWLAFYWGGLHPALALVPVMPFVPHAARDAGLFVESHSRDTLNAFEHWWKIPVHVMLFFFGLVNAGVEVASVGAGTWIVLTAILLGKPIGIVSCTALSVAAGLRRPAGVTWRDLTVIGIVAAIGFTVALFFATAAFPAGELLDQTKMGALLSFSAAIVAVTAALLLKVGRMARA
ncbi:MAG: sodium:proton antiporter [Acidobacteria bacterium]|nr:sodium:proton antiporter [Acidobacteriota bacterium]